MARWSVDLGEAVIVGDRFLGGREAGAPERTDSRAARRSPSGTCPRRAARSGFSSARPATISRRWRPCWPCYNGWRTRSAPASVEALFTRAEEVGLLRNTGRAEEPAAAGGHADAVAGDEFRARVRVARRRADRARGRPAEHLRFAGDALAGDGVPRPAGETAAHGVAAAADGRRRVRGDGVSSRWISDRRAVRGDAELPQHGAGRRAALRVDFAARLAGSL